MTARSIALKTLLISILVMSACAGDAPEDADAPAEEVTEGLTIVDVEEGEGEPAESGDTVTVHYTGTLEDGTEFDSSVGGEPFTFTLGTGGVIAGWDQGVPGMKEGGVRELTIASDLGYGEAGFPPDIPPGATLIFEIEMIEIQPAD